MNSFLPSRIYLGWRCWVVMYSMTLLATHAGKDSSSTVNMTTGIVGIWRGSREEPLPTISPFGRHRRTDDDRRAPAHTASRFAAAAAIVGSQGGRRMLFLVILVPALHALLLAIGVLLAPAFEILPSLHNSLRFLLVAGARGPRLLRFRMRAPFVGVRRA